jgi:AraC-like DNA-binding protein
MSNMSIDYNIIKPEKSLGPYIQFFWHLKNKTPIEKKVIILPDGYFDIIFYSTNNSPFEGLLVGLSTEPTSYTIPSDSVTFSISFKLPAAEYIIKTKLADVLNGRLKLSRHYWEMDHFNVNDFKSFVRTVTGQINEALSDETNTRKQELFNLIYQRSGLITVSEIADTIHWSSRQINRYFSEWFGLTLKKYCTILRYRASFKHIKDGKLFPEAHFSDQAHFIKEIKKFSGVTPKELSRNKDDRFIQFSTLPD